MTAVQNPASLPSLLGPHCFDDPDRLRRYEIPERGEPGKASGLLLPQSEAEVGQLLAACSAHGVKLVISAGRTGLVEAQRPDGECVLSLEKLDQPLRFTTPDGDVFAFGERAAPETHADALAAWWRARGAPPCADGVLETQAGIAVDAVNRILEPLGLMWPMEMGSSSAASVGGCVANASAGANAVCYGTAAHLAVQAFGFSGDGRAIVSDAPAWKAVPEDLLAINSAAPHPEWGLIGTQGVLGVITRVRLRAYAIPGQREAALIPVADMPAAMRILAAARALFGADVEEFEFIGKPALELVRHLKGEAFRSPLARHDAPYYLLLQVKSHKAHVDLAGMLYEFLADDVSLPEEQIGYAPLKALKEIRHSITEASNHRMRELGGGRLSFDTATPVSVFGDYLKVLEAELKAEFPNVALIAFGHAGVGGAHLHILGTKDAPVSQHAKALVKIVFDVTQDFGGTFSAEHGVGTKWGDEFIARAPAATHTALVAAKRRHDPQATLSPRSFALDRLLLA
ncbi:FAD-binding oxidoreductase [Nevskia sp.]|uniref:FAD-binding oxidoreductase n=1 Tax=Nevskia sp. TaxID=1929292 RepID=UPI0025D02797|nr:FAD-binding oxidoreductase [Nevskia sp.]